MPDQTHIQRLRGTTEAVDNYTGVEGELVINQGSNSIRVHDGVTQGGLGTVNATYMDELPADGVAPKDLPDGAHVIVGEGPLEGNATKIVTGDITTSGTEGSLEVVENAPNDFTINANFPAAGGEQYTAYSTSEEESEELKELMPDGGIIIERQPDTKPVMKQIVEGQLVATELSGGIQATYTENSDETDSIIDEVEEGALIVEGEGPLVVQSVPTLSTEDNNILEEKSDGLYGHRSAYHTANEEATNAIADIIPEDSLIIEGDGSIVAEITDPDAVHKTGDEEVAGVKTFLSTPIVQHDTNPDFVLRNPTVKRGPSDENHNFGFIAFQGQDGIPTGHIHSSINSDGDVFMSLVAQNEQGGAGISLVSNADGSKSTTAITPQANSNSTDIATTAWVRSNIDANVVHKTGNETIAGVKEFSDVVHFKNRSGFQHPTFVYDGTPPAEWTNVGYFRYLDSRGRNVAYDLLDAEPNGKIVLRRRVISSTGEIKATLELGISATGVGSVACTTPPDTSNSDEIATTKWVRNQSATDTQIHVNITGYNDANAAFKEYFRYSKYGKLVIVDIGGLMPKVVGSAIGLCLNGSTNLPVMRSRPVVNIIDDQDAGSFVTVYGWANTNSLYFHARNSASSSLGHYGQIMYFTD